MGILASQLILSIKDLVTGPARAVAGSIGQLKRAAAQNSRQLSQMRGRMYEAAGAAYVLYAAISKPLGAAMEFESAMADVNKVVDFDTPDGFAKMSKDILEMSKIVPMTATSIASIVAAAGQADMKGEELLQFTNMAAKVGVAFDVSAEKVGTSLAKIKSALGMSVGETSALADAMNHLSNTSASEAPLLLNYMRRVGSIGKQYGFTAQQTVAIGSAMIAAGAQADVAATSFRNVGKALVRGQGATKSQRAAFRLLGLDASEVAKAMQKDAVGTLNDVIGRIRGLEKELQATTISSLFGDEARAIAPLIENSQLLTKALGAVASQTVYLGSTQKEFAIRSATAENALQLFKNKVHALSIAIGNALLPTFTDALAAIGPYINKIAELATAHPEVTKAVIGLVGGLVALRVISIASRFAFLFLKGGLIDVGIVAAKSAGLVLSSAFRMREAMALATATGGSGGIISGFISVLTSMTGGLISAVTGVVTALATITAPVWGVIVLIIAAIAAVALAVHKYWEPISNFISGFAEGVVTALEPLIDAISGFGGRMVSAAGEWATTRLINIGEFLGIDEATIRAAIAVAMDAISGTADKIISVFKAIPAAVGNWVSELFTIKDYSDQQEAEFRNAGKAAGEAAVNAIIGAFKALTVGMFSLGKKIMDGLLEGIIAGAAAILSFVGNLGTQIKQSITGAARGAFNSVKGMFGFGSSAAKAATLPARAMGGQIKAGMSYITSEQGPEVITASRDGYVHNATASRGMMNGGSGASGMSLSIGSLVLPNVRNAEDLLRDLQQMASEQMAGIHADGEWSVG